MAATKKKLSLYHLLLHEVSAANKNLKKPLSKSRKDSIVRKFYEVYRYFPKSQFQITIAREQIAGEIKDLQKRLENKGLSRYQQVLREAYELNKKVKEEQRLLYPDVQKLASLVYKKHKGKKKINWEEVRRDIASELQKLKKDICDVLAIQENIYNQGINYFEIDSFIEDILPPCIYVAVNAGGYGQTEIFNTKDYEYYGSGVQRITNEINKAIREGDLPLDTDKNPKYFGEIQIRPGKQNDGEPNSYFLEMVLVIEDEPVEELEPVKLPKRKKTKKRTKREKKVKEFIKQALKKLKAEKSKVKTIRQKIAKLSYDFKNEERSLNRMIKLKVLTPRQKKDYIEKLYRAEKKKLDISKAKKILNQYQYNELLKNLKGIFGKN